MRKIQVKISSPIGQYKNVLKVGVIRIGWMITHLSRAN